MSYVKMFFLTKPSRERIQRLIDSSRKAPFNYAEVGQSLGPTPAGYVANHGRARLGYGEAIFNKAVDALRRMLQKRFARESTRLMLKAVGEGRSD